MKAEFFRILLRQGFSTERAYKTAEIFTLNSVEGIYSHGVYRFSRFVRSIRQGLVKPDALPTLVSRSGGVEQWNGNLGPGPLNAVFATDRACDLAADHGIGMVTLAATNHWMRGGTYGWQAARKGYALICWTNTCRNMPAWGAKDARLGNNPLIIAVPYSDEAVVADLAMSQYSYGKLETYRKAGKKLPYMGGFNKNDELTDDPAEILASLRPLPAGYWKGSALSLLLDILATVLSGGMATHEIGSCDTEANMSQVFIAIGLKNLNNSQQAGAAIERIIADLRQSEPSGGSEPVRYPGEHIVQVRIDNLKNGIPVYRETWEKIKAL